MKNHDSIEFDRIVVWNFSKHKSKRITDIKFREYLSKLLAINRINDKPIENIGIITIKDKKGYKPFTESEKKRVSDLRKILFLCSVAKSNIDQGPNAGLIWVTAENFSVAYHNFTFDSPDISYSSGGIVHRTDGGYNIYDFKYEIPRYVLHNTFITAAIKYYTSMFGKDKTPLSFGHPP